MDLGIGIGIERKGMSRKRGLSGGTCADGRDRCGCTVGVELGDGGAIGELHTILFEGGGGWIGTGFTAVCGCTAQREVGEVPS